MVSFQNLRDVDPAEFEQAADGYHSVSSAASEAKDRLAQQILAKTFPNTSGGPGDGLAGEAAAAAEKRLERLRKSFHYTQVECGLISATLNGFAAELRAAKKKLTTAVAEAESAGFKVGENGSISWTADGPLLLEQNVTARESAIPFANPDPKRVKALGFAERIEDALNEAAGADQEWGPKLAKLKAQNDLTVSAKDWANVHGDQKAVQKVAGDYLSKDSIPNGESPEHNRQWWNGLSEQEKSDYVSLYPASVGALDGIPSVVRDDANRAVLAETKGSFQTQLDAIPPEPRRYRGPGFSTTPEWQEWDEKYGKERHDRLSEQINGMNAIQARFDRTGQEGLPEAYLLGFDPEGEGRGRVILANGNPDEADHTAVYVPGTGASLGGISGDITRGESMWKTSNSLAPSSDVSTITWLDYGPPPNIPHAGSHDYAEEGAPQLNNFLQGTETAQGGPAGSHTTVIGHSYGSTLVGEASNQGDLSADDIVVAGSPGMQVDSADDLDVGSEHMWSMRADDDNAVALGGRVTGLSDGWWSIPTGERFGGNVMETDTSGHSGYWDSNESGQPSLSLENQSNVIVGNYGKVVMDE